MKTTDSIRGVVAELDERGLVPRKAEISLPDCDTRSEFVRVARAFAANNVGHGPNHLWATRRDGIVEIAVFAGEWWRQVEPNSREKVYRDVRTEILSVLLDADDEPVRVERCPECGADDICEAAECSAVHCAACDALVPA